MLPAFGRWSMRRIDASRWALVAPVLDELLYADEGRCAERLAQIRAQDSELADDVAHFLAQRARIERDRFLCGNALDRAAGSELPSSPSQVGPYRLLRELGVGGMASVWLAVRLGAPPDERVALKIPHTPWQRAGLAERLDHEGAILAKLQHPNIARLADAGVAVEGQPYLALEYVQGEPIDVYCDRLALDVRARLSLFVQVVHAVAYAHSRQVVHRDLKPSNILVDAGGQVRLLDFGIAKLLDQATTAESDLTRRFGRALTPRYASPEQIHGRPVGAATDVFSLGVVLYELLTGSRPRQADGPGGTSEAEAPRRPSELVGDAQVREALRRGLDAIVLKALEQSPFDRYRSAEVLADDIQRYLDDRPVLAQLSAKAAGDSK